MKGKITVTGVNLLFFIFSIIFILSQVVLAIINTIFNLKLFDKNIYVVLLLNQFVFILIPIVVFAAAKRLNIKEVFRLNKLRAVPALFVVLLSIPAYMVALMLNSIVAYLLQFIGEIPEQPIPVPQNIPELLIGILIIGVSPAICEELLHRGLLLKAYEKRGSLKAVVITSLFFGIFHMDITNLVGPIFLGLLIGYYVIKTNSIFAGMLAHFLNNTIAEILSYFSKYWTENPESTQISLADLGTYLMLGFAFLIVLIILLRWFTYFTGRDSTLKSSISSVKGDAVSILSHWPVIATMVLYVIINALTLIIMIFEKYSGTPK